jgi:hypothetical protein
VKTVVQAEAEPTGRIPVNGEPIKARGFQLVVWTAIGIVLGPALIAGIYYAWWEMHWFIHIGPLFWKGWSLKAWWDAGTWWPRWLGHWVLYRHLAFRDLLEPAAATMYIKTFLASSKTWKLRASVPRLVLTPPALLVAAILLGCVGVWVLDLGGPNAWHALFGHYVLTGGVITVLGKVSAGPLLWGVGMGFILHRFWAPVGSTIQGFYVDRGVDRVQSSVAAHTKVTFPVWVRYPVAPVQIRERFGWLWSRNAVIKKVGATSKWLIWTITIAVVLLTILGLLARYYFAKGHYLPYLNPRP